uniref:Uncharacterized protein n=1 Tax=Cucumis sativus TaxID=3659 RepID=A0A0A0LTM7_CUCSA
MESGSDGDGGTKGLWKTNWVSEGSAALDSGAVRARRRRWRGSATHRERKRRGEMRGSRESYRWKKKDAEEIFTY